VFTDYARPAIRLACIMEQPVIYVMTHDSIGLGEDGTTHQPVEQLASLRVMHGLHIIRPADANEGAYAWRAAIQHTKGPTMLVLTRQKLSIIDRNKYAAADGLYKGAYILSKEKKSKPDVILIATGSEVEIILKAQDELAKQNIDARVISMPSWELFRAQPKKYMDEVLPPDVKKRISLEAASTMGWREWIGDEGKAIGVDTFGHSAPYQELYKFFGLTVDNVVATAKQMV
jgi:transketolase